MDRPAVAHQVLYIDDDPGIGRLVQRQLTRAGFEVTLAEGGEEGERLAASGHFDAIGLDHYMPGRDGLEVLDALMALPDPPPVIFVTGAEEPRIAVTALKNGAADYVVKDVQGGFIDKLATSITQEIVRSRLQHEKEAAEREVRESRDRLERLAAQQAVLLKEMNHRVANSLQLISSLIELQARKVGDETARALLRQAAERVEAVTLVHRRLYTCQDVEFVEMESYLTGLVEELSRATRGQDGPSRIILTAAPVRLETDRAVAVGLVVNELVTNALKYAYPDGAGPVRVVLQDEDSEGLLRLIVEDDGVGFADDAPPRGSGLGSLIVSSMAHSLRAQVERDAGHGGTRFVITLPPPVIAV
jgi:two-component sensor histidine kinase